MPKYLTWIELQSVMKGATERELQSLLTRERRREPRRKVVLARLYARYSQLRRTRELEEILG